MRIKFKTLDSDGTNKDWIAEHKDGRLTLRLASTPRTLSAFISTHALKAIITNNKSYVKLAPESEHLREKLAKLVAAAEL